MILIHQPGPVTPQSNAIDRFTSIQANMTNQITSFLKKSHADQWSSSNRLTWNAFNLEDWFRGQDSKTHRCFLHRCMRKGVYKKTLENLLKIHLHAYPSEAGLIVPNVFFKACTKGYIGVVDFCIKEEFSLIEDCIDGALPLALDGRHMTILNRLLRLKSNLTDSLCETLLRKAAHSGDLAIFRWVAPWTPFAEGRQDMVQVALVTASKYGHLEIVNSLVQDGIDQEDLGAALVGAAGFDQPEMVRFLIDQGADVNHRSSFPMRVAIGRGRRLAVAALLEKGATCDDALVRRAWSRFLCRNGAVIWALVKFSRAQQDMDFGWMTRFFNSC